MYSITKRDFDELCVKDFHNYLVSISAMKKIARDSIVEQAKKEFQTKNSQLHTNSEKLFSFKNKTLSSMVAKPALKHINRHAVREDRFSESIKQVSTEPSSPPKIPLFRIEADKYRPLVLALLMFNRLLNQPSEAIRKVSPSQKEKDMRNTSTVLNMSKQASEPRPSTSSQNKPGELNTVLETHPELQVIRQMKLFYQDDIKQLRKYNGMITKLSETKKAAPNTLSSIRNDQSPSNNILKEVSKGAKKFKAHNDSLFDIRNVIKTEGDLDEEVTNGSTFFRGSTPTANNQASTTFSKSPKASSSYFLSKFDFDARRSTTPIVTNSFNSQFAIKHDQYDIYKRNNSSKPNFSSKTFMAIEPVQGIGSLEEMDDEEEEAPPIVHANTEQLGSIIAQTKGTLGHLDHINLNFDDDSLSPMHQKAISSFYGRSPVNQMNKSTVTGIGTNSPADDKSSSKGFSYKLSSKPTMSQTKKIKEYRNKIFKKAGLRAQDPKLTEFSEPVKSGTPMNANFNAAILKTWDGHI